MTGRLAAARSSSARGVTHRSAATVFQHDWRIPASRLSTGDTPREHADRDAGDAGRRFENLRFGSVRSPSTSGHLSTRDTGRFGSPRCCTSVRFFRRTLSAMLISAISASPPRCEAAGAASAPRLASTNGDHESGSGGVHHRRRQPPDVPRSNVGRAERSAAGWLRS
jgi:hypothetical protein